MSEYMDKKSCTDWAYLKEDTPFSEIFPDRHVPIRSIFPIIPREQGSPPCYVVDSSFLSQMQIDALAEQLFYMWQPECSSLEEAKDYIMQGLPLKTDWFNGASSSSPVVLFGLMDDEGVKSKREEELEELADLGEFAEAEYDLDFYGYDPDDYGLFGE